MQNCGVFGRELSDFVNFLAIFGGLWMPETLPAGLEKIKVGGERSRK